MMTQFRTYHLWTIALDVLCAVFISAAMYHLSQKPDLPANIALTPESTEVISLNGVAVSSSDDREVILMQFDIGDSVAVGISSPSGEREVLAMLGPANSTAHMWTLSIAAWLFFLLGVSVYSLRPQEFTARIFHVASLATSMAIIGTQTMAGFSSKLIGSLLCSMFFAAYSLSPALFVHFTLVFPKKYQLYKLRVHLVTYGVGVIFAIGMSYTFLTAAALGSLTVFHASQQWRLYFNAFLLLAVLSGIVNVIISYHRSDTISEKKKLRWILCGLTFGTMPFITLWVLPEVFRLKPLIPEALAIGSLVIIPAAFAISIVKYRVMNIDVVINRSIVYGIVLGGFAVAYALVVGHLADWFGAYTGTTSIVLMTAIALVIAILVEPARKRVQNFVDTKFFRVQYDFREAQRRLFDEIKHSLTLKQLGELIVSETDALLPVARIGFFFARQPDYRAQLIAHTHFDILERHSFRLEVEQLTTQLKHPIGMLENVERGANVEQGDETMFNRWHIKLVFPMTSKDGRILGFLVLGEKKSGLRFATEDVDLLNAITIQAGLAIERIVLQQEVILQQEETERLAELNRMKSYFVSSVSHDLKTPLTSIKMFAEMLRTKRSVPKHTAHEYLEIIEGEAHRLTIMVNNVLSFAKTERGSEKYYFESVALNTLVQKVLRLMSYQFKMEKCQVITRLCADDVVIHADADAVTRTLINLLSNAMKYSSDCKHISVVTSANEHRAIVSVEDKGAGISSDDLRHLFEPFFRAKEGQTYNASGAGLGLSIVKHIMDAHSGEIQVQSELGKGSTFTLLFPMLNSGEHIQ